MSEEEIKDIRTNVGKIFVRLGNIETMLQERCTNHGKRLDVLDDKVNGFERLRYLITGAAAVLGGAGGYILKGLGLN